jgi:hypothetical protein
MLKNCPSCGRPIKFEEKYTKIVVCPYCNSILEFWNEELTKVWEQWEFIEFPSQFIVGKETEWQDKKVKVKWELRYEYDWGFFSEFFVEINWKNYYILEDDWNIKLIKNWNWEKSNLSLLDKEVWNTIEILWKKIFVMETWIFKLTWIKWFVNTLLIPWKNYEYLDWIFWWKMFFIEKEIWTDRIRINEEININEI